MVDSTQRIIRLSAVALAAVGSCRAFTPSSASLAMGSRISSTQPLYMSGFPHNEGDILSINSKHSKRGKQTLSAVAIDTPLDYNSYGYDDSDLDIMNPDSSSNGIFMEDWLLPVLSTSFLITANTVGASCLVLPELAAGPGFAPTCVISLLTYAVNLISGLVMAEVAIKQYESSGSEVASSFKDFADASFGNNPILSSSIAWVSILTNACVLAFTFSKAGQIGSELMAGATGGVLGDVDPMTVSFGFVGLIGVMLSMLNSEKLSNVASVCVGGLFVSFAGLLLPGLAAVQDPLATLTAPGIADNCLASATTAFPIVLLSLVYQNIVPSVVKILNYDRQKTTASLALGSFIPLAMYLAWCFASMGGGLEATDGLTSGVESLFLTGFSLATIAGSSVGTTMSVAEEFDSFFKSGAGEENDEEMIASMAVEDMGLPETTCSSVTTSSSPNKESSNNDVFSMPAVAASLAVPMLGAMFGGNDMTVALGLAGSIGTPLLYGVVPALMAWNQRREEVQRTQNLVPGGMASLGALGLASTGFVGQELAHVFGDVASLAS